MLLVSMGESALSLVARMVTRPALFKNYSIFEEDGLKHKEVVQVTGKAGAGKSLLLLDLLKKCILPKLYGGEEAEVVFIDTCDFNIIQLVSMLELEILLRLKSIPDPYSTAPSEVSDVIESSLARLHIFVPDDFENLCSQFHYLKTFLISKPNVGVIMLDSISEFYWQYTKYRKDLRKMDTFVSYILNYIHNLLCSFNISFIYTRPSYLYSNLNAQIDPSKTFNLKNVNTFISISYSKEEVLFYKVEIKRQKEVTSIKTFKILEDGRIKWLCNAM